jgi:hypothetical protein
MEANVQKNVTVFVPKKSWKQRGMGPHSARSWLRIPFLCFAWKHHPPLFLLVLDEREYLGGIEEPESILSPR